MDDETFDALSARGVLMESESPALFP